MKFQVNDQNEIRWMRDPDEHDVGDVVKKIKDAGKWDQLLEIEQDEEGVVDCDSLYDYLRHDASGALLSVGLHYNEAVATVDDVVAAWENEHVGDGTRVSRLADGKPSGLQLFDYGPAHGISLEFEAIGQDGEVEEVSLDPDEVFDLVSHMAYGNATTGAWDCTDVVAAEFEMWRERE